MGRNMRFFKVSTLLVLSVILASPAFARYGFCEASIQNAPALANGLYPKHISGVLDFGEEGELYRAANDEFAVIYGNRADCTSVYPTIREAEEAKQRLITATSGRSNDTQWVGAYAAQDTRLPKPTGAFITIKDNGIAARLKAWDNVLLQAKREEAGRKAAIAALTAESKAKYQQIIDKAVAEAKKRGRVQ